MKHKGGKKVSLYPDGHIELIGDFDSTYVANLARAHLEHLNKKEDETKSELNGSQEDKMYALDKESKAILKFIKKFNYQSNDWPTQSAIRNEINRELAILKGDVYYKRKLDSLEEKRFVIKTKSTRGKKIMFTKEFQS